VIAGSTSAQLVSSNLERREKLRRKSREEKKEEKYTVVFLFFSRSRVEVKL